MLIQAAQGNNQLFEIIWKPLHKATPTFLRTESQPGRLFLTSLHSRANGRFDVLVSAAQGAGAGAAGAGPCASTRDGTGRPQRHHSHQQRGPPARIRSTARCEPPTAAGAGGSHICCCCCGFWRGVCRFPLERTQTGHRSGHRSSHPSRTGPEPGPAFGPRRANPAQHSGGNSGRWGSHQLFLCHCFFTSIPNTDLYVQGAQRRSNKVGGKPKCSL